MKHGDVAISIDYCFTILFRDKCDYRKTWICDVSAGDERVICNQEHIGGSDIYQITCKHKKTNIMCLDLKRWIHYVLRMKYFSPLCCVRYISSNYFKKTFNATVWLKAEDSKSALLKEPDGESKVVLIKASIHTDKVKEKLILRPQLTKCLHTHFKIFFISHAQNRPLKPLQGGGVLPCWLWETPSFLDAGPCCWQRL